MLRSTAARAKPARPPWLAPPSRRLRRCFGVAYAGAVEPEITPEPSPAERAAILAALQDQNADAGAPPAYRSLWRLDGIRESVEDEDESG